MRLLLSICLLLASVVAARAQSLSWPTPGAPTFGETVQDSYAAADAQCREPSGRCLDQALAETAAGDDGKAPMVWMTRAPSPRVDVGCVAHAAAEPGVYPSDAPCDDRRAIRAFRRVLLPPDSV